MRSMVEVSHLSTIAGLTVGKPLHHAFGAVPLPTLRVGRIFYLTAAPCGCRRRGAHARR
jgi:hypothetical protein